MSEDGYSVQIGTDVIVIGAPMPYPGWSDFFEKIKLIIENIYKTEVIEKVTRLGVRFINFFDFDVFKKINLEIQINDSLHNNHNTQLRTEIKKGDFLHTLNIANNATQIIQNGTERIGSIIDIDTFKDYRLDNFKTIYEIEIQNAHNFEKEIFFNLLNSDYLKSLDPKY
jgi:uncharacterized protein (TIGR04255 family)